MLYLPSKYHKKELSLGHLKECMQKEGFTDLYVIDERGITKNEPQYEFYQRFSSLYNLWVDTGPREIGDVVDDIFSGANKIVIRGDLWMDESLEAIRAMTHHDIYLAFDGKMIGRVTENQHLLNAADGVILFITEQARLSFSDEAEMNRIINKKPVYIFDNPCNEEKWKEKEINGFLQDIAMYM